MFDPRETQWYKNALNVEGGYAKISTYPDLPLISFAIHIRIVDLDQ